MHDCDLSDHGFVWQLDGKCATSDPLPSSAAVFSYLDALMCERANSNNNLVRQHKKQQKAKDDLLSVCFKLWSSLSAAVVWRASCTRSLPSRYVFSLLAMWRVVICWRKRIIGGRSHFCSGLLSGFFCSLIWRRRSYEAALDWASEVKRVSATVLSMRASAA